MDALWHWFLALLGSLSLLLPGGEPPTEPETPVLPVSIEQQYGDAPEVAGITTNLPPVAIKKTIERNDSWAPPETDELTAESIVIMDKTSGKVLWSRSPEKVWPTASITKLMAAIVFMEEAKQREITWDTVYTMAESDEVDGTVYIYRGEEVTVDDLFHLSLVGSVNSATRALFHAIGLNDDEVVETMNRQARTFGLWNTTFSDVTGLDDANVTTAKEAAWLLKEALLYDDIQQTLRLPSYEFTTRSGRDISVMNTNKLLGGDLVVEGGKTGFITESRYNFAVSVQNETRDAVIVVVMGTNEIDLRFSEAAFLAGWAFENYHWQ